MAAPRGLIHAYRGRIDASRSDATHAVELAKNSDCHCSPSSRLGRSGSRPCQLATLVEAHEQLAPFAADARAWHRGAALCRVLPDEIEALTRLGELDAAEALLGPFEARSARLGREWGKAAAVRCRGLLLAARGQLPVAEEAIQAAVAMHQRLPMPFEEARTLLAAGEIHRRARHKHRASGRLQAALVIFEQLGAPLWQRRVLDQLARGGGQATPPGERLVLTMAEQRVADLVAIGVIELAYFQGWTHTEIAEGTQIPLGTVKARMRLGLLHLKQILSGIGDR